MSILVKSMCSGDIWKMSKKPRRLLHTQFFGPAASDKNQEGRVLERRGGGEARILSKGPRTGTLNL